MSIGKVPEMLSQQNIQFLFNCRLVTTFYGVSIVGEQERVRKSWMSRMQHPMLRLNPHTLVHAYAQPGGWLATWWAGWSG